MMKTPFYALFVALACFGCAESEPVVVVRQDVAPIAPAGPPMMWQIGR